MGAEENEITLFHYSFSPYAKRVVWYLTLRGIKYNQCMQPPVLPRPDLKALGISYRRIPVMAIGRDIYCDTRLMLRKLERIYPNKTLGVSDPDHRALERLLDVWTIDSGIFARAGQLIPPETPLLKDQNFTKDREDFSGRSWSAEDMAKARPEALAHIRDAFQFLETTLFVDGRDWILKTPRPSLADIETIWIFDWLSGLKGALPQAVISSAQYPEVFSWIQRFRQAVKEAKASSPNPTTLKGNETTTRILSSAYAEPEAEVDACDPLQLEKGEEIEVWPIDSGFRHRDQGTLVGLNADEVVIKVQAKEGEDLRVHFPRTNFRIRALGKGGSKL